jgi:hypothetical protein
MAKNMLGILNQIKCMVKVSIVSKTEMSSQEYLKITSVMGKVFIKRRMAVSSLDSLTMDLSTAKAATNILMVWSKRVNILTILKREPG